MNKIIELILTYFEAKKTQGVRERVQTNFIIITTLLVKGGRTFTTERMTIQVLYVRIE